MNRKVVLDTETTGLKVEEGHRMVEFGAIELIDNKPTGKTLHLYFNPERDVSEEVVKIHGLDNKFLADKPLFKDCADQILEFLKGADIIAHNLPFDAKMLNMEMERAHKLKIWNYALKPIDTCELSKMIYKGQRDEAGKLYKHNLDALCDRLGVDRTSRTLHGALLDSEILADVYIKLMELYPLDEMEEKIEKNNWVRPEVYRFNNVHLKVANVQPDDVKAHLIEVRAMAKDKKINPEELEEHIKFLQQNYYVQKERMAKKGSQIRPS